MKTNNSNPYSNNQSGQSNTAKRAGVAAAVVGVAGAGVAGAKVLHDKLTIDKGPEVVPEEEITIPDADTPVTNPEPPASTTPPAAPHTPPTPEKPEEKPDDKTDDNQDGKRDTPDNPGGQNNHNEEPTPEEIAEYDEKNLNPDAEVDKVLAEEQIDHDGDSEVSGDMLIHDYEEVGMIYGPDGEAQMATVAYDPNGEQILLVDVDGDQMFDTGYTESGDIYDVSELAINVGDAELEATANDEYLANNGENEENFLGEDFTEDIIS